MPKLANKIALVTGASRGIGRACALKLAKEGAQIIAHYNNAHAEAQSLVKEIRDLGGKADVVSVDLAARDGAHHLAAKARDLVKNKIDIIVANAGAASLSSLADQTVEEFDRLFAINVRAPFFLVQQMLPLLTQGSSIILLSSIVARFAFGDQLPAYSATKGAVSTLVKQFAAALGEKEIRVNGIAPGVIETDMSSKYSGTKEGREMTLSLQLLQNRLGQPDDVADVVVFLASNDSRWVTGQVLEVSGGLRC